MSFSWADDKDSVTVALLTVGLAVNLIPLVMEIPNTTREKVDRVSLNRGEKVGGAIVLSAGAATSYAIRSWLPIMATVGVVFALYMLYETNMEDAPGEA